jgi:hypothetical protein
MGSAFIAPSPPLGIAIGCGLMPTLIAAAGGSASQHLIEQRLLRGPLGGDARRQLQALSTQLDQQLAEGRIGFIGDVPPGDLARRVAGRQLG